MSKDKEIIYQQIQQLLQNGQLIQAIKLIRKVNKNMSLRDAKNFIERFRDEISEAQSQRQLQRKQGIEPVGYQNRDAQEQAKYSIDYTHRHSHRIEKDLPTEVFLYLQKGETIQAIKLLRELRGLNLNQANQLVQSFYRENPQYQTATIKPKRNLIPFIIGLIAGLLILRNFF